VRVSVYAERVLRRWYVVVLAVLAGAGIVLLHGVGRSTGQYDAKATVYMGQPVAPGGGAVTNQFANASAVSKVITSDGALGDAARAAGVSVDSLRGRVTAHLLSSSATTVTGAKTSSGATYFQIEAQGPWGKRAAGRIANVLAAHLRDAANVFTDLKEKQLKATIASEQRAITALQAANAQARAQLAASGSGSEAAILLQIISQNTSAITDNQTAIANNQMELASATTVEAASVTTTASGKAVTARTRRSSILVGALAGLIVGVGLALAWDAVRTRPRVVTA
jgi:hypothetical protein